MSYIRKTRKVKRSTFIDRLTCDVRDEWGKIVPVCYEFYNGHVMLDYRLHWGKPWEIIKEWLDAQGIVYVERMRHIPQSESYQGMTEFPILIIANSNFSNADVLDPDT